jgi:RNA recognition motif-containing protein
MSNRVFVGKVSQSTSRETLVDEFSKCGEVTNVDVKNGYAFVFYANEDGCNEAINTLNGKDIDGSNIVVEAARVRDFKQKPLKRLDLRLSVTGLEARVSWQDLKDWARKAGDVTFTNIFVKDGVHMGVIEFAVCRIRNFCRWRGIWVV